MSARSRLCSACGTPMGFRLGEFECASCGRLEPAAPVVVVPEKRGAPGAANGATQDTGAKYRLDAAAEGISAQNDARAFAAPARGSAGAKPGMSRKQLTGFKMLLIGGLGFVLPLTGMQFVVLSIFGPFEYIAAGAMVVFGVILLASPEN